jgi:orotidine-5'-phosphate decarboxylase
MRTPSQENMTKDPIIIALDFDCADEARALVKALGEEVTFYKVGMELYAAAGPDYVRELAGQGKSVFLDMKFYDIGETVKRATAMVAKTGAQLLTVHGSMAVMRAAIEGRGGSSLRLLGVTVLTSFDEQDMRDLGFPCEPATLVLHRALNAKDAGMDGIVSSPLEASNLRRVLGPEMMIVTPGVRSSGASRGDQKRVATPAEAMQDGASHLVIGRQVTRASNPVEAVRQIRAEIG